MANSRRAIASSYLLPINGPALEPIELKAGVGGVVLGRHEQCDVCLPADAEKVSRFHARFDHDGTRWHVTDLGSRWGTFVNGVRVTPQTDLSLSEGDLIRIMPWTFALSPTARRRGLKSSDDSGTTIVRTVAHDPARPISESLLPLLLETAAAVHAATDEKHLADLVIDAARRGTGFQNAALLRPIDSEPHLEIVAANMPSDQEGKLRQEVNFSRSLIAAASQGAVAEIDAAASNAGFDISQSVMQLKINSAICVPLMLGHTVAAYLYLDSRGTLLQPSSIRPGASAFCVALGRMASLALANLKRIEIEKRNADFRAEMAAAAEAQKWIMPQRRGRYGPFSTIGESRPGQYVGGDLFDILPLGPDRLAVALGDVSGKGVSASVLMTATQGFLNAALSNCGDPGRAVTELNRFLMPRRPEGKFVTLWVGALDATTGTLAYVDAGHSYALLRRRNGEFQRLDQGGGLPVGVEEQTQYRAEILKIEPGETLIVVSDGIVEQPRDVGAEAAGGKRVQFQLSGLQNALVLAGTDQVEDIFSAVVKHAGTTQLSDDATAVLVQWESGT